jgi:hypothetical protein
MSDEMQSVQVDINNLKVSIAIVLKRLLCVRKSRKASGTLFLGNGNP